MAGEVLMTLGSVRFSLAEGAYEALTRDLEVRVARLDRAGKAARQVLGIDETIEIEGVHFAEHFGDVNRIETLRELARTMEPQMLTDGTGKVWGRWIVERVGEHATRHIANGVPLMQEYRLSLGAYGEDA